MHLVTNKFAWGVFLLVAGHPLAARSQGPSDPLPLLVQQRSWKTDIFRLGENGEPINRKDDRAYAFLSDSARKFNLARTMADNSIDSCRWSREPIKTLRINFYYTPGSQPEQYDYQIRPSSPNQIVFRSVPVKGQRELIYILHLSR